MAIIKSFYKTLRVFPDPDYFYIQNEYNGTNTFTLTKYGTPATTDLEYSKDKSTWTQFDLTQSSNTVSLNSGEKLYMRSSTGFSAGSSNYLQMRCNQNCSVGGHISSLLNYQNIDSIIAIPSFGFYNLFSNSSKFISVSNLDFSGITTVGDYGMQYMFYGCTSLTTMPDFSNLTSVGICGMQQTFQDCTSLTTAPDFSNLTSVGNSGMQNMFKSCTSLTTAPDLSSLTTVSGGAMQNMFQDCSSLNLVTTPNISSWNSSISYNWLDGVAATGVVRKPAALTNIPTDSASGIPTGWTTTDY